MKIDKNMAALAEQAFKQVDGLGFKLDLMGVENKLNRHTIIANVMAGQKRVEGEIDSLTARVQSEKAKLESLAKLSVDYVKSGVELATFPAKYALARVKPQA